MGYSGQQGGYAPLSIVGGDLLQYQSGALCPLNQEILLYQDDFSGYGVGQAPGNPPWTRFQDANIVMSKQVNGSTPVLQFSNTVNPSINTAGGMFWNQGYVNFASNPCGVWIECKIIQRNMAFSDGLVAGLCIGMGDLSTTTRLLWHFINQGNTANGCVGTATTMFSTANNLIDSAAIRPNDGDTVKFKLARVGAFGWNLLCFINGVQQGSSNNSLIQLATATPKNLGMFASIDPSGAPVTDFWQLANCRMGVC